LSRPLDDSQLSQSRRWPWAWRVHLLFAIAWMGLGISALATGRLTLGIPWLVFALVWFAIAFYYRRSN
jgi:hypothetical protein